MRTARNLPRHELIGLSVEIVESPNDSEVGINGKVVDEGKNILKLELNDEEKIIQKCDRVFEFKLPDCNKVRIDGKIIYGNPVMRIKKRLNKW